jgi:micrococcal nuclease
LVRNGRTLSLLGAFCLFGASAGLHRGQADESRSDFCRPARFEAAVAAGVNERLELELPDGRAIRLAGVESPLILGAASRLAPGAAEDVGLWTSAPVLIHVLKPKADRWGRREGRAFFSEDGVSPADLPSVAEAIIDAGFARVDPATEARPCLDQLYAAEQRARAARRGVWADAAYAVLDTANPEAFAARVGEIVIVQGVVANVRAGRGLTFVNLGDGGLQDPALIIGRDALRAMQREGMKPEWLAGRSIRARGLLDLRTGPRVDVSGPGAIEILPPFVAGR